MKSKHNLRIAFFVLAVLFLSSFRSHISSPNPVVGIWRISEYIVTGCADPKLDGTVVLCDKAKSEQKSINCVITEFLANLSYTSTANGTVKEKGTYKIEGNKLITTTEGKEPTTFTFSVNGNTLTLTTPLNGCNATFKYFK